MAIRGSLLQQRVPIQTQQRREILPYGICSVRRTPPCCQLATRQPCSTDAGIAASAKPWWPLLSAGRTSSRILVRSTQQDTDAKAEERTNGSTSSNEASVPASPPAPSAPAAVAERTVEEQKKVEGLQRTMAGLDALLGIIEEPSKSNTNISVSPDALKQLAEAEAKRLSSGDASQTGPLKDDLEGRFQKIVERARKLASENDGKQGLQSELEQAKLRNEFETLLQTLTKPGGVEPVSKEDIKKLRESVFGPMTFWVTETVPLLEGERIGVTVRGNLRDDRTKVFDLLRTKLAALFPGKYEVFMVQDIEAELEEARSEAKQASGKAGNTAGGPRVAFQIFPAAMAVPPQQTGWRRGIALVTVLLLLAACIQLALVANVGKLPKETIEYFANPDSYPQLPDGAAPPGFEKWDADSYFATAIPIASSIFAINVVHELGHRIAAYVRNVRLGPSFYVPNLQIGSFGAITPFASLLKGRKDLWDVAAAGPLGGILMSASLLGLGLLQSNTGVAKELLVTVPSTLFQGSLLLGTVTRMALGDDALRTAEVMVSPLVIAGWCGLITNALQLLPVGSLDGGRLVQASFGKQALALSSFFTYVGLGLGLLGSTLALPFGLYVIICQREAEAYIQDSVSPAGEVRQTATLVAVLTAVLILLPMAPELADSFGVGASNPFL